jgi:hypothetical protein
MATQPATLDSEEWAALEAAFARSAYRQVIEQLCASGNSPISASELFKDLNLDQGRDVVNVMLGRHEFPYRLNFSDTEGDIADRNRKLALYRT